MIIGIGTDIIEIERVERAARNERFVERCYSGSEAADRSPQTLAGNFACKEAVAKALGTGFRGFTPKDVEILRDGVGKPYVRLANKARELADGCVIHVSISHCQSYATAVAVVESRGDFS